MRRTVLIMSALLVLVSGLMWSIVLDADPKSLGDYDPKPLVIVVNRDSSDVTIIDPATDKIIKQIALGTYTNAHMAMPSHDGKKILISATGRDRFLVQRVTIKCPNITPPALGLRPLPWPQTSRTS
jgi:YVTN family beta-propeller protein